MRIRMTLAAAEEFMATLYDGPSDVLSVCYNTAEPNDRAWWSTNPKPEKIHTRRHQAAMRLYLELGRRTEFALPADSFPAVFSFSDRRHRRPDKAFIKTCLIDPHSLLSADTHEQGLIFHLTTEGRAWLDRQLA